MPNRYEKASASAILRNAEPGSDWPDYVAKACGMNVEKMSNNFHEFTGQLCERLADLIEPEPERTCRIVHRNDFQKALGEHSIWYECGFGIMIADGTQEPVYCPGCGAKVVDDA